MGRNYGSQLFLKACYDVCVSTKDTAPPGVRLAGGASKEPRNPKAV